MSFFNNDDDLFTNPWREMHKINRIMNNLFDDAYTQQKQQSLQNKDNTSNQLATTSSSSSNNNSLAPFSNTFDWTPRWDLSETEKEYNVHVELPGVNKNDVKIDVENGILTVSGEKKSEVKEEGKKYHRVERSYGSFKRSVKLPDGIKPESVKATFDNGVLDISGI